MERTQIDLYQKQYIDQKKNTTSIDVLSRVKLK